MERVLGTKTDEKVEESTFIWCIKWSYDEAVNFKEVLFFRYNKNSWKRLSVDTTQVSESENKLYHQVFMVNIFNSLIYTYSRQDILFHIQCHICCKILEIKFMCSYFLTRPAHRHPGGPAQSQSGDARGS